MTISENARQTDLLLRISLEDERVLDAPVSDAIFGFHAQQAIEKALKALITERGERHEFTHDLSVLVEHLRELDEQMPELPMDIVPLSEYAGLFRYTISPELSDETKATIKGSVRVVHAHVAQRVVDLRA